MNKRVRRFRLDYDPHVRCCCSVEEHLSGEYVLLEDYMNLLREYNEAMGAERKPDKAKCAVSGCDNDAVQMWGGRPHCEDCLPPFLQKDWQEQHPIRFDPSD